jgi:hypothetical protein
MRSSPMRRSRFPEADVSLGEVLREWRAAERVLAELVPGTPEWTRALGEVELLRSRYQQVLSAAGPMIDGAGSAEVA